MTAATIFGTAASAGEQRCRTNVEYGVPHLSEQVWASIYPEPNTGCWLWGGRLDKDGYGAYVTRALPMSSAHRQIFSILVGPIPLGLELDHLCRTRPCVNPAHLEVVTAEENKRRRTADSLRTNLRRDLPRPIRPDAATHCTRGHEYTPENTAYSRKPDRKKPTRVCRACTSAAQLARRQRALTSTTTK